MKNIKTLIFLTIILSLFANLSFAISNDAKKIWPRPRGTYIPNAGPNWRDHLATGYNDFWAKNYEQAFTEWAYEVNHNATKKVVNKKFQTINSLIGLSKLIAHDPKFFLKVNGLFIQTLKAFHDPEYFYQYSIFLYNNHYPVEALKVIKKAIIMNKTNKKFKLLYKYIYNSIKNKK